MVETIDNVNHKSKNRDYVMDIMKGIGIFLVIFGHVIQDVYIINSFHMPLFFVLSGAALCYSTKGSSISKRAKRLLVPYFVFSIIWFIYWALIESHIRPVHNEPLFQGPLGSLPFVFQEFLNIFLAVNGRNAFIYNVVLWFLPCLFISDFIFNKVKNSFMEVPFVILLLFLYYFCLDICPPLLFCVKPALIGVSLLAIGFHCYQPVLKLLNKLSIRGGVLLTFVSLLLFLISYFFLKPHVDMVYNCIPPVHRFYPVAIIGILSVMCISVVLAHWRFPSIVMLGQNSLTLMCIHDPIKRIIISLFSNVFQLETVYMRHNVLWSLAITLAIIAVCWPIILFVNKHCSCILGIKLLLSDKT